MAKALNVSVNNLVQQCCDYTLVDMEYGWLVDFERQEHFKADSKKQPSASK